MNSPPSREDLSTVRRPAIDAHAHVFVRGLPLASHRRYAPDYDAPLEQYLEHLDHHGLSHGVIVQPSFLGTDNAHLVAALRSRPSRLRGIAVVEPTIGRDELRALDAVGVVGIRLNLVEQPLPDFDAPAWRSLLDALRERSWHVEIQRSSVDIAYIGRALIDRGLEVVLDHFALPSVDVAAPESAFDRVLALGATRRAWVKLSAPYRIGPDGGEDLRPIHRALRRAFGKSNASCGEATGRTPASSAARPTRRTGASSMRSSPMRMSAIASSPHRANSIGCSGERSRGGFAAWRVAPTDRPLGRRSDPPEVALVARSRRQRDAQGPPA